MTHLLPPYRHIETALEAILLQKVTLNKLFPVAGGSINKTYKADTDSGTYFIKQNDISKQPNMFQAEIKGLELLNQCKSIRVPEVIGNYDDTFNSYLVLEWIEASATNKLFWEEFAKGLSYLHKNTASSFGLGFDNYIGSLPQKNTQHGNWADFFVSQRLEVMLAMARNNQKADAQLCKKFDALFNRIAEIFPKEVPSLLHGDLWSGNFMCTTKGEPCIFDPAPYYGHREMDIAMTKLFGGFDQSFYTFYGQYFPLEKDWEKRISICNLYPLLVHLNLFGGSYLHEIRVILKPF